MKKEKGITRRAFVRMGGTLAAASTLSTTIHAEDSTPATPPTPPGNETDYIDPTIGNVAPLLNPNRPVVHLPNQMVRVFPVRKDHLDVQITSFPLCALNIITPQTIFSLKPVAGEITEDSWTRKMLWDHDMEETHPWYFAETLTENDIKVEYTTGKRGGIYRFTFPKQVKKNLLLSHYYRDGKYALQTNAVSGIEMVNDANHQQRGSAYMYGIFSGSPLAGKDGERIWISYSQSDSNPVEFRYAISFISIEQAKKNFIKEMANATFESLVSKGKATWQKVIGQVKVQGGTDAQKRTFYTALYRTYARMINISEDNEYFSGYDKTIHKDQRDFYTDDYTWGGYLAHHPLRTILNPDMQADMLQSYVRMYEQGGWMPEYPKVYGDRAGMFGFHSCVMFLDAWRKGINNFDVKKAIEGMIKSADQATMLPGKNGPKGDLEDFYYSKGYYPALRPGEKGELRSAVAVTLAHSYDAWALGELAKETGDAITYDRFVPRANNYKNLYWADRKFFMPKDAEGNWIDIDPKFDGGAGGREYYNENNGWGYLWNVQHDIPGLINLMGGKKAFEERLDQLFREELGRSKYDFWAKFPDQTGLIGQFSMGNQVTFFIPYLYNYTDSPWKTQKYTRLVIDTWFKDNIFGVPGDEDAGSMSSFVVFSCLGFYPVSPGIPLYAITSPLFEKISISLQNGKTFTLIADNCSKTNKYIQSATLNDRKLDSLFFSHDDLANGGTLVLTMGEKPVLYS